MGKQKLMDEELMGLIILLLAWQKKREKRATEMTKAEMIIEWGKQQALEQAAEKVIEQERKKTTETAELLLGDKNKELAGKTDNWRNFEPVIVE